MMAWKYFLMILGAGLFGSASALVIYDVYLAEQLRRLCMSAAAGTAANLARKSLENSRAKSFADGMVRTAGEQEKSWTYRQVPPRLTSPFYPKTARMSSGHAFFPSSGAQRTMRIVVVRKQA
jgi:hypothetical protein